MHTPRPTGSVITQHINTSHQTRRLKLRRGRRKASAPRNPAHGANKRTGGPVWSFRPLPPPPPPLTTTTNRSFYSTPSKSLGDSARMEMLEIERRDSILRIQAGLTQVPVATRASHPPYHLQLQLC